MKKLGLIGGTGPESTVMYYRGIVGGVGEIRGNECIPPMLIENLSAFEVFRYCGAEDFAGLAEYLLAGIGNLAAGGAEFGAISANTPHIVFDEVSARSPIPLVSVVEATRDEARDRGLRKIGLLGTGFTMENDFFMAPFEGSGIDIVVPGADEIGYVQEKIATELEHGVVTEQTRRGFVRIVEDMVERDGIEQVVLGCTELPLILDDSVSPVPCLDTAGIHIRALVREIVG